jgi:hypothetical protein
MPCLLSAQESIAPVQAVLQRLPQFADNIVGTRRPAGDWTCSAHAAKKSMGSSM